MSFGWIQEIQEDIFKYECFIQDTKNISICLEALKSDIPLDKIFISLSVLCHIIEKMRDQIQPDMAVSSVQFLIDFSLHQFSQLEQSTKTISIFKMANNAISLLFVIFWNREISIREIWKKFTSFTASDPIRILECASSIVNAFSTAPPELSDEITNFSSNGLITAIELYDIYSSSPFVCPLFKSCLSYFGVSDFSPNKFSLHVSPLLIPKIMSSPDLIPRLTNFFVTSSDSIPLECLMYISGIKNSLFMGTAFEIYRSLACSITSITDFFVTKFQTGTFPNFKTLEIFIRYFSIFMNRISTQVSFLNSIKELTDCFTSIFHFTEIVFSYSLIPHLTYDNKHIPLDIINAWKSLQIIFYSKAGQLQIKGSTKDYIIKSSEYYLTFLENSIDLNPTPECFEALFFDNTLTLPFFDLSKCDFQAFTNFITDHLNNILNKENEQFKQEKIALILQIIGNIIKLPEPCAPSPSDQECYKILFSSTISMLKYADLLREKNEEKPLFERSALEFSLIFKYSVFSPNFNLNYEDFIDINNLFKKPDLEIYLYSKPIHSLEYFSNQICIVEKAILILEKLQTNLPIQLIDSLLTNHSALRFPFLADPDPDMIKQRIKFFNLLEIWREFRKAPFEVLVKIEPGFDPIQVAINLTGIFQPMKKEFLQFVEYLFPLQSQLLVSQAIFHKEPIISKIILKCWRSMLQDRYNKKIFSDQSSLGITIFRQSTEMLIPIIQSISKISISIKEGDQNEPLLARLLVLIFDVCHDLLASQWVAWKVFEIYNDNTYSDFLTNLFELLNSLFFPSILLYPKTTISLFALFSVLTNFHIQFLFFQGNHLFDTIFKSCLWLLKNNYNLIQIREDAKTILIKLQQFLLKNKDRISFVDGFHNYIGPLLKACILVILDALVKNKDSALGASEVLRLFFKLDEAFSKQLHDFLENEILSKTEYENRDEVLNKYEKIWEQPPSSMNGKEFAEFLEYILRAIPKFQNEFVNTFAPLDESQLL